MSNLSSLQEFMHAVEESGTFSGGPIERFEEVGRRSLAKSIDSGLMPDHALLDVGAGSLRVAWWFLHYIDPSNYHAIEPRQERVETGRALLGMDINLYHNDDFTFPDLAFDFVFARSIWTHASKPQIVTMLSEFAQNLMAAPDAKFLASFIPANTAEEDYSGDEWTHAKHREAWIRDECNKLGLALDVGGIVCGQTWALVSKA